ncbi:MAG: barstar family protein [Nocardioidaceae bacterium]
MSGLAAVLAGRRAAGVYRWVSGAHVQQVRHTVEHAGWRFVHLDTARVDDQPGFLNETRQAYDLDSSHGDDLPALAQDLADVRHHAGTVTLWEGWSPFARTHPEAFSAALDTLAARANSRSGGVFVVLLRGAGPDLQITELDPHGAEHASGPPPR